MQKLKSPVVLETAFASYTVDAILGEGGAGIVYGGVDAQGAAVALKVLTSERATKDRKSRFDKEIKFLSRNSHPNIVTVTDWGLAPAGGKIAGTFFVMKRYDTNLRDLMSAKINPNDALPIFVGILDGVEAAHLLGVTHRDLKPENILYDSVSKTAVIADFGIARFTEEILVGPDTPENQRRRPPIHQATRTRGRRGRSPRCCKLKAD